MNTNETVIVVGRSGSGKGTQITLLKDYLNKNYQGLDIFHFESGEGFRNFIKKDGHTANILGKVIEKGGLAPDFITEWLVTRAFIEHITGEEFLIVDGFPRTISQAQTFDEMMKYYGYTNIKVIHIKVSESEVCNRLYNRGRSDDKQLESIKRKIDWYNSNVIEAVNYMQSQDGYQMIDVNGEKTIKKVHQDIINKLEMNT